MPVSVYDVAMDDLVYSAGVQFYNYIKSIAGQLSTGRREYEKSKTALRRPKRPYIQQEFRERIQKDETYTEVQMTQCSDTNTLP